MNIPGRASTTSSTSRPSTTASTPSTPTGGAARRSGRTASSTRQPASRPSRRPTPARCCDIPPEIGITGTPVIDPATGHDLRRREDQGGHRRHDELRAATARARHRDRRREVRRPGRDPGERARHRDRIVRAGRSRSTRCARTSGPALLLANGVRLLRRSRATATTSRTTAGCWATTRRRSSRSWRYCTTPNGESGGIWMGGDGVAADSTGNLYFITGDGDVRREHRRRRLRRQRSSSSARAARSPTTSRRTTRRTSTASNLDLGSGGVLLLPDQPGAHPHEMVSAGKNGTIYLVDRDNMGHFNPTQRPDRAVARQHLPDRRLRQHRELQRARLLQRLLSTSRPVAGHLSGLPADERPALDHADLARRQRLRRHRPAPSTRAAARWRSPPTAADERDPLGAAEQRRTAPGTLHAYDPTQPGERVLQQRPGRPRDTLDRWLKFTVPLVATAGSTSTSTGQLTAYGLLP